MATSISPDRIASGCLTGFITLTHRFSSFDAHVSDIREVSRNQGRSLWQIALDRSAFYPTSGGQPHDTGLLTATSSGGALLEAPILAVEEDEQGRGVAHNAEAVVGWDCGARIR